MNVRPSCSGLLPGCSVAIPFCVHTVSAVLPSSGLEVGVWFRSRALVGPVWVTPPASAGFRCDQEGETLRGAVKQPPECVSSQGQGRAEGLTLKLLANQAPSRAWCQLYFLDSLLFKHRKPGHHCHGSRP